MVFAGFLCLLTSFPATSQGQSTTSDQPEATLASAINVGPTIVPNIQDPTAPVSQGVCPGYTAENVRASATGLTADLNLAGPACRTYGVDVDALSLLVEYQNKHRLHVQIFPKYMGAENRSWFVLEPFISGYPGIDEGFGGSDESDLAFNWSNTPTFQFEVARSGDGEVIFSTYGHKIVYQNQFIELATSMVPDYNVFGLAENTHDFRLGTNYTQVYGNADAGNTIDENMYGTHPVYIENRYSNGSSSAHGVYARNAHAQEWLLRTNNITYRTTGGSLDFYFVSGPTPKDAVAQYQSGIIGYPQMQMYWTLGFHQCRWGYQNWTILQDVLDSYRSAGINLDSIWNDIDYMEQYRDFTNGHLTYPVSAAQDFLTRLHANSQHYVPIVDSNLYASDPTNTSDVYEPYMRGAAADVFIRNGAEGYYYGDNWPGFSVWTDYLSSRAQEFWTFELSTWYKDISFDGVWIDLNEFSSYTYGSAGTGELSNNPVRPPFLLPGEPGDIPYEYPESFNITNSTEAISASSASSTQAAATATAMTPSGSMLPRSAPTPGGRNLLFPPYAINNVKIGYTLSEYTISTNATHNDRYNTTQYDIHNANGHLILNATHNALLSIFPGRRPFVLGRSTFAGSGTIGAHWGGDNTSKWGTGIPLFGVDTCGFSGNSDFELCTRWMELSAFFTFYRNHNQIGTIGQEAYVWSSTAEAARRVMHIRYSLLPYMYTLFYQAHTQAAMVMRPLQFEFPDEEYLRGVDNQFLLGPSILVTPVLTPQATTVKGVFPGVGGANGIIWYDWYTLLPEQVSPRENKTLAAPLEHIPVHVRGGSILPLQRPGYTTAESRQNPWNLLVALDTNTQASGELYLDDGESIAPNATREVTFTYSDDHVLQASAKGTYSDTNPLANVTITGLKEQSGPRSVTLNANECLNEKGVVVRYDRPWLSISGLQGFTSGGAWKNAILDIKILF